MRATWLNIVCAHPAGISWAFGALALNALVWSVIVGEIALVEIVANGEILLYGGLAVISATLLGYFVGMFFC